MNAELLKKEAAARIEEICQFLLPDGKRKGSQWVVGSVDGEPGNSLGVSLTGDHAGQWNDFADPDSGGSIIDLWMKRRGVADFNPARLQLQEFLGIKDVEESDFYQPKAIKQYVRPVDVIEPICSGEPVSEYLTGERCLDPVVLDKYRVGQMIHPVIGESICFPCYDPSGKQVDLIKFLGVNRPGGKKQIASSKDSRPRLFGWQAVGSNDRRVAISEGEIDTLTIAGWGLTSLSMPQGATNLQWIESDFEALDQFEKIYVCSDDDPPGNKAAEEIADRLGRERCYRIVFPGFKDANEALCSGKFGRSEFELLVSKSRTMDPKMLKAAGDFVDGAWERLHPTSKETGGTKPPWDIPYRIRRGEITIWSGMSGHGKSLALNNIVVKDVDQGERCMICSLEIPPAKTVELLARIALGYKPAIDQRDKFEHAVGWLSDRVFLLNHVGWMHWSKFLPIMEYAATKKGCTRFVVDSLLFCGVSQDKFDPTREFIGVLTDFAGKYGHVHLVAHARKAEDESRSPNKMDVKGSGDITDMTQNGFTVWRNKEKERSIEEMTMGVYDQPSMDKVLLECDGQLSMWKNRETGEEPFRRLWLHKPSGQFSTNPTDKPHQYIT